MGGLGLRGDNGLRGCLLVADWNGRQLGASELGGWSWGGERNDPEPAEC